MKFSFAKSFCLTLFISMLTIAAPAMAADAAAGKSNSAICSTCHGPAGVSVNPMWPNLAGQQEMYLAKQMKDFRDGIRKDPVMAPLVASLSDEDIENLAAYYAGL